MDIGVISDTHGRLRVEALIALEGCGLILHAGDVCGPLIIPALEEIAPTFAVAGNCDEPGSWPWEQSVEYAGLRFLLHHGHRPVDEAAFRPQVVITGHTHVPLIAQDGAVLRLNPGSAGPRRFDLPVTVARIKVDGGVPCARIIHLPVV